MMLGQKYLDVKKLLSETLFSLRNHDPDAGPWNELSHELNDPFLIMVAGEVNAGKSTLVNALLGETISPTGILPTTEKTLYLHYGEKTLATDPTPELRTISHPSPLLKECHLIDTPGIDGVNSRHPNDALKLIPHIDAAIFVLSATQPWSQTTWKFLTHLHQEHLKEVILVLQQSDLRTEAEISAILDYIQVLSQKKLGVKIPTFALSAREVLKNSELPDHEVESRFPTFHAFKSYLSELLAKRAPKWKHLRHIAWTARKRITKQSDLHQKHELDIRRGWEALEHAKKQIQTHLHQFQACWEPVQKQIVDLYSDFQQTAQDTLHRRLSFINSLSSLKHPDEPDQLLNQRLVSSLEKNSVSLIHLTQTHWETHRQQFTRDLRAHIAAESEIHAFHLPKLSTATKEESDEKLERLRSGILQFTEDLDLPRTLRPALQFRKFGMIGLLLAILASSASALTGWLLQNQLLLALGIVAFLVSVVLCVIFGHQLRNTSQKRLAHHLDDQKEHLREILKQWLSEEVSRESQRYFEGYEAAKLALNQREEDYLQIKEHLDEHHKKLADVEQQAEKKLAA